MKRPELGSWHTITGRAKKVHDDNLVHWQAVDIEDRDSRRGQLDYPDTKTPSMHHVWSDGRQWQPAPPITSYHAMYIGYRYKFNGKWEGAISHEDPADDYDYFSQTETV